MRVVAGAERHADRAVLGENDALLFGGQLREAAAPAQRIPHRPGPRRVQHRPPRPVEQRFCQIRLVADRVGPAEHRVFRLLGQRRERRRVQQRAQRLEKDRRVAAERQQRDTARIVDVLVEHRVEPAACHGCGERGRIGAAAEREQLHEQPIVRSLRLSVLDAAAFADVGRLGAAPCFGRHEPEYNPRLDAGTDGRRIR